MLLRDIHVTSRSNIYDISITLYHSVFPSSVADDQSCTQQKCHAISFAIQ